RSGCLAVSLILGAISLVSAIAALTARPPHTSQSTVLFPFFGDDSESRHQATTFLKKVCAGMQIEELGQEYALQLLNVGIILRKKVQWSRLAAHFFLAQVSAVVVGGVLFIGLEFVFRD